MAPIDGTELFGLHVENGTRGLAKASGKRLGSDEKMIVVAEAEETRRKSDVYILTLVGPASVHPRVTVNAPDEIDWKVMFGSRAGNQVEETVPGKRVELPGTLLPGQVIQGSVVASGRGSSVVILDNYVHLDA